jgi:hypothetical protein
MMPKLYQKCTKVTYNVPNGHKNVLKIFQMAPKVISIFPKALYCPNLPKLVSLVSFGNPGHLVFFPILVYCAMKKLATLLGNRGKHKVIPFI